MALGLILALFKGEVVLEVLAISLSISHYYLSIFLEMSKVSARKRGSISSIPDVEKTHGGRGTRDKYKVFYAFLGFQRLKLSNLTVSRKAV